MIIISNQKNLDINLVQRVLNKKIVQRDLYGENRLKKERNLHVVNDSNSKNYVKVSSFFFLIYFPFIVKFDIK